MITATQSLLPDLVLDTRLVIGDLDDVKHADPAHDKDRVSQHPHVAHAILDSPIINGIERISLPPTHGERSRWSVRSAAGVGAQPVTDVALLIGLEVSLEIESLWEERRLVSTSSTRAGRSTPSSPRDADNLYRARARRS